MQTQVDGDRQTLENPKNQVALQFKGFHFGSAPSKIEHLLKIEKEPKFTGCFKQVSITSFTCLCFHSAN